MITAEQIPIEVGNAIIRARKDGLDARNIAAAALNAWPGRRCIIEGEPGHENEEIILPIQEKGR